MAVLAELRRVDGVVRAPPPGLVGEVGRARARRGRRAPAAARRRDRGGAGRPPRAAAATGAAAGAAAASGDRRAGAGAGRLRVADVDGRLRHALLVRQVGRAREVLRVLRDRRRPPSAPPRRPWPPATPPGRSSSAASLGRGSSAGRPPACVGRRRGALRRPRPRRPPRASAAAGPRPPARRRRRGGGGRRAVAAGGAGCHARVGAADRVGAVAPPPPAASSAARRAPASGAAAPRIAGRLTRLRTSPIASGMSSRCGRDVLGELRRCRRPPSRRPSSRRPGSTCDSRMSSGHHRLAGAERHLLRELVEPRLAARARPGRGGSARGTPGRRAGARSAGRRRRLQTWPCDLRSPPAAAHALDERLADDEEHGDEEGDPQRAQHGPDHVRRSAAADMIGS